MKRPGRSLSLSAVATGLAVAAVLLGPTAAASATGFAWSQASEVEAPEGAPASKNFELNGVACPAVGSCVAVGDYQTETGVVKAAVVSESGGTWARASEAKSFATGIAVLNSVACTGVGSCVAVGYYAYDEESHFLPMVITETGGVWGTAEAVKLPANAETAKPHKGGDLNGVTCAPSGSCTAVGGYTLETTFADRTMVVTKGAGGWEGQEQLSPGNAEALPIETLDSVSCPAAGSCVAVGGYRETTDGREQAMALDEVSEVWGTPTELTLPEGAEENPEASMQSVACPAAGACVAVGKYKQSGKVQGMLAHSTGGAFGGAIPIVAPENATSGETGHFVAVTCPPTGLCVAVGFYPSSAVPGRGMAASGSGGEWTRATEVLPPSNAVATTGGTELTSVACPAAGSCVAVGNYESTRPRQAMVATGINGSEKSPEGAKEKTPEGSKTETPIIKAPTGTVALSGTTLTVKSSGQTAVKLTCTGTATCSGKLTLTVKRIVHKGKKKHTKNETIASASFSVPAGGTATIKLKLNAVGRSLLHAAHGRLSATLAIVKSSPSPSVTLEKGVHLDLKATKPKHKH